MGLMRFNGINNYLRILTTGDYYFYFLNSLFVIIFTIPIGQILAFMFASLLKKRMRFSSAFFEAVIFLPLLVSMVGASIIMSYLFAPNGPVNYIAQALELQSVNWLGTTSGARTVIVVLEIWKGVGLYVFVYLSALRAIPSDYYEVAKIEGARPHQVLWRITIPLVRRTIFFCCTMTFIWQIQIFDSVYATTLGGPFNTTKTIVYAIYETTFLKSRPGIGSAVSVCFLFVILLITAVQNKFSDKLEIFEY
jgi:ABC-type sugar transport system permease subunit